MQNANDLFKSEASAFVDRQIEVTRLERESNLRKHVWQRELESKQKRKFDWLIQQAQQIITNLLNDNSSEFSKYLLKIFRMTHDHFDDLTGVCGFPQHEHEPAREVASSDILVGPSAEIVNAVLTARLNSPTFHIRVLTLYEEKMVRIHEAETFVEGQLIITNGRSDTDQILALVVKSKSMFGEISPEELRGARVVLLSRTSTDRSPDCDYSEANPVSFDHGFIYALLELVDPMMAFKLIIKKLGLPKD